MATWKERGEVPDSDDDEDIESQSLGRNTDTAQPGIENTLEYRKEKSGIDCEDDTLRNSQDKTDEYQNGIPQRNEAIHVAFPTTNFIASAASSPLSDLSSPITYPVFQIPDLEGVLDEEVDQIPVAQGSPQGSPPEDDISRSYVQITSRASSRHLSPTGGLPEPPSFRKSQFGSRSSTPDPSETLPELPGRRPFQHNSRRSTPELRDEEPTLRMRSIEIPIQHPAADDGGIYPMKRALRHRNAIQLHPYVVENEKYRRTLKARGIAPMRLDSSQAEPQHAPRRSLTPDLDFQQEDTPDVGRPVGESQAMDIDYAVPSSSLARPPESREDNLISVNNDRQGNDPGNPNDEDEEEDFPDIDELLRSRHDIPVKKALKKVEKRSRLRSYSHKFKRPVLPKIMTQSSKSKQPARHDQSISVFPASPPKTSSPQVNMPPRRTVITNGGTRSLEPSPSWLSQDELQSRRATDLPTPSTSALKPQTISTSLDSDSDDPFASDVASDKEGSVSSSSSDESVQIRKITKKFRGVLPASHLRLDLNNKQQKSRRSDRHYESVSPIKSMPRRGIALPRTQSGTMYNARSPSAVTGTEFPILSDESDEDNTSAFIMQEDDNDAHLESLFDTSRIGYAEEDDRVDAMLPSRKRPSTASNRPKKKRKLNSSSLQRTGSIEYKRQPKITKHLGNTPKRSYNDLPRSTHPRKIKKKKKRAIAARMPTPPSIGLLDVVDMLGTQATQPDFIRIAARAARSSTMQGRHKPTGKFFRLATREDTEDVQSVLKDWTSGMFQPKELPSLNERVGRMSRKSLSRIDNNQTQVHLAPSRTANKPTQHRVQSSQAIRKLPVNRRQQSINDFIRREQIPPPPTRLLANDDQPGLSYDHIPQKRRRLANQPARPAQLEALEVEYTKRYPSTTFKSSKRALDALYRKTRKRPMPSTNLQLTRFLADEDVVLPSVEQNPRIGLAAPEEVIDVPRPQSLPRVAGRQKPLPRRVDIGAAVYRQPSDPLILDYLVPQVEREGRSESKLRGLARFGEKYSQNFNILPLPSGVFFHASTFFGSGRLFHLMSQTPADDFDHDTTTNVFINLDQVKRFHWGKWDENVSSEMGICFDWLVDQLACDDPRSTATSAAATMNVVKSLCDYMQHSLASHGVLNEMTFLSRMLEVLKDFSARVQVQDLTQDFKVQLGVQVLSMVCAIAFRLLSSAHLRQQCSGLAFNFEDVLQTIAGKCAQLLVSRDMSILYKLYDDLQYLSFRDNGIRNEQFVAEGWVVLMKLLTSANIPRGSFWDVVNPALMAVKIGTIVDAPAMERIWYNMFTLIPLFEFDEHGVVLQDARLHASFDNWHLPQQLLKRVFHLYTNNTRQSPGFNDYCRALIGRCHCLIVEWGWWNCSAVIGTIFDFFATHNLAHLRNEEAYTSAAFLTELAFNPNLSVESEDRCFHIFLKIVALTLKRFSSLNKLKSAGNLVARLQPNHNRHYPKEESIHQKDLASLRNHHDLLCTLFWAAPSSQRPSLHRIEQVVDISTSHAEAVEVHSQSRRNLANFLYSTDSNPNDLNEMAEWMDRSIRGLMDQYEAVAGNTRADASVLFVTEAQIGVLITKNKNRILSLILGELDHWKEGIEVATSLPNAIAAFNPDLARELLNRISIDSKAPTNGLLEHAVNLIDVYLKKIEKLRPSIPGNLNDDSQNSFNEADVYTLDVIETLKYVHDQFALLIQDGLERSFETRNSTKISMQYLLSVWANMAAVFIDAETHNVGDYLESGKYAVFKTLEQHETGEKYWPFFVACVVSLCSDTDKFKLPNFSLERLWILKLSAPRVPQDFEDSLTQCLAAKGFPLCGYIKKMETTGQWSSPLAKIKAAIMAIEETHYVGRTAGYSVELDNQLASYHNILDDIETFMQEQLEALAPQQSKEHLEYLAKVREIVSCIATHTTGFHAISKFYSNDSRSYWATQKDPFQFSAYLGAYCRQLYHHRDHTKTSQLFYFLCNSWHAHLQADGLGLGIYAKHVFQNLKSWSLLQFTLAEFLPIVIEASFQSDCSALWITFIKPVVKACENVLCLKVVDILGESDTYEAKMERAKWVCGAILRILMQMVNEVGPERNDYDATRAAYRTWVNIIPGLRVCLTQNDFPGIKDTMNPILTKLNDFAKGDAVTFGDWEYEIVDAAFGKSITLLNRRNTVKDVMQMAETRLRLKTVGEETIVQSADGRGEHIVRLDCPGLDWGETLLLLMDHSEKSGMNMDSEDSYVDVHTSSKQ